MVEEREAELGLAEPSEWVQEAREALVEHGLDPSDPKNSYDIQICRGKPRCTARNKKQRNDCVWCYNLSVNDMRSTEKVIDDMERFHS